MIKHYSFFAKWRKKDVEFLNKLSLSRTVEEGYFGFSIEEGVAYDTIINYFSHKDSLFKKTKPTEFLVNFGLVTFSKQDLDDAKYYSLEGINWNNGYPEPQKELKYQDIIFTYTNQDYGIGKTQTNSFKVKKPKWGKNQVGFNLEWEFEFLFFKKIFFQEVLKPLGLKSMEVLDKKGNVLEDTIQLLIPTAKSKLLLENSAYDIHPLEETGGYKQYALQTLGFLPPFEKEFDFHICYSQEEQLRGHRKIIISKEFCNLLVKHKIIEYNTWNLTPQKNK